MNNNLQPNRMFRQPVEHDLPPGDWLPLPSRTHHSAGAFLLSSGQKRMLLTGSRQALYRVEGSPDMLVEDAPMNRFEIGKKDGAIYICSALSERGRSDLLDNQKDVQPLESQACSDGDLRLFWTREEKQKRKTILMGRLSPESLSKETTEPLFSDYETIPSPLANISLDSHVKVERRSGQVIFFWLSDGIPSAMTHVIHREALSGENGSFYSKRRILSYSPLGKDVKPLRLWYHLGRIHALLVCDNQLICIRESLERGGDGEIRVLASDVECPSATLSKDGELYLSWREAVDDTIVFARIRSGDIFEADLQCTRVFYAANRLEIVLDDHERAHLLLFHGDQQSFSLRGLSWGSNQEDQLLYLDHLDPLGHPDGLGSMGSGARVAFAEDRYGIQRALVVVSSEKAHLLLPINRALPTTPSDRIGEDG